MKKVVAGAQDRCYFANTGPRTGRFLKAEKQNELTDARALAVPMVHSCLQRRGMSLEQLAARLGLGRRSLQTLLGKGVPGWRLRWRIEREFGFEVPFWSVPEDIEIRKRCLREFGVDPRCLEDSELRDFCLRLGVRRPTVRRMEAWYQALILWLALHRERPKTQEPHEKSNITP